MKPSDFRTSLTLRTGLVLLLASSFLATLRAADTVESALQRGLVAEEAQRDLRAAAEAYQQAVRLGDQQREAQATAIYRLGEVQRRLGNTDAARLQFVRILTEFPDQTNLVALARNEVPLSSPSSAQEPLIGQFLAEAEFQRDTAALQLAKLDKAIANFQTANRSNLVQILAFRPNRLLETLLADLNVAEQQNARLSPDFGPQHPEMLRIVGLLKTLNQQLQDVAQGIKAALVEEQSSASLLVARLESRVTSLKELQRAFQQNPKNPDSGDLAKAPPQAPAMSPEEAEELERLKKLAAESPDLLRRVHEGVTPLQIAASRGWTAVSGFLLSQGVPIDGVARYEYGQDRGTPLHRAARTGSVELVTLLLNKGADPNTRKANEGTPLHSAARAGRLSAAEKLILAGAYIEARSTKAIPGSAPDSEWESGSDGNTPLHLAAYYGRPIIAEMLLRRGANFDATNSQGEPPIWVAAFGRKPDTFRQLLAAGANAKVTLAHVPLPKSAWPKWIPTTWTLLMWASAADEMELVKSLLESGADPNTITDNGQTALHLAAGKEVAQALLEAGAKVNSPVAGMRTPLDMDPPEDVAIILRQAGGTNTTKRVTDPSGVTNGLGRNQAKAPTFFPRFPTAHVTGEIVSKLDFGTNSRLSLRESIVRLAPPPTADLTRLSIKRPTANGPTNWLVDLTDTNVPDTEIIAGDSIYVPARPVKK